MTTKIGLSGSEVTVADPVYDGPYEYGKEMIGAVTRTLNGTRVRHVADQKAFYRVTWEGLTDTQLSTLTTELDRKSDLSWVPPTGGTVTVQVDSYTVQAFTQDTWKVVAMMEEV